MRVCSCAAVLLAASSVAAQFDFPNLPDLGSLDLPDLTGSPDDIFGSIVDWLGGKIGPEVVDSFDAEEYVGRWYQMYASLIPTVTYERDGKCITADYALNEDGSLNITNSQRISDPVNGTLDVIYGTASAPDSDVPAKLEVDFVDGPSGGDYWIIALGPVEDGEYQWAVVSDSLRTTLFVLARDVSTFESDYEDEVKSLLKDKGFKYPWNAPIKTYQESDCNYAEEP